ncbi:MAG: methyltransferase regulatory domain-containing protein [Thiotrichales bacterium]
MDTYDEIPYQSTPFPETHPTTLAALGRLFGVATPDPACCRVLELGCAAGGNLVPMAWQLPGTECLGIELSARQAADGEALIRATGLGNVRIRQGDIALLDTSLGQFDYIITHGVYSWVPAPVREKLLALCRALLAPTGVAYISYNTLPGWRMRGVLRDMLLENTRDAVGPRAKLAAAHAFLDFMDEALRDLDALTARYLKHEIEYLRRAHPSYLYHEYLETVNEPFWFTQFVDDADRHGLQYLCDTDLHMSFPSALGERVDQLFSGMDDLFERERHLDYIRLRNFRQSLLVHADVERYRDPSLAAFETLALAADLVPPKSVDYKRAKRQTFLKADGTEVPVQHPLTKAALVHLSERFPDSLAYDELTALAQHTVKQAGGPVFVAQTEHLAGELFSLFAHHYVSAEPTARLLAPGLIERPLATPLARHQSDSGNLATIRHANLELDAFGRQLLALCDGTRTVEQLVTTLLKAFESGALVPPGTLERNPDKRGRQVAVNVQHLLALFARQGVLTAA